MGQCGADSDAATTWWLTLNDGKARGRSRSGILIAVVVIVHGGEILDETLLKPCLKVTIIHCMMGMAINLIGHMEGSPHLCPTKIGTKALLGNPKLPCPRGKATCHLS